MRPAPRQAAGGGWGRRIVNTAGLGVAAVTAALALAACGGNHDAAPAAPAGAPATGASAGSAGGLSQETYQQMEAKVNAAESAASEAESDATSSP